jgi:hypothetical protein
VLLVTKENVLFQLTIRNKDGRIVSSYEKDKLVPGAYALCCCGVTALGKTDSLFMYSRNRVNHSIRTVFN